MLKQQHLKKFVKEYFYMLTPHNKLNKKNHYNFDAKNALEKKDATHALKISLFLSPAK